MLPTKFCMFYELSETILFFGLRYLHLDIFSSCTGTYLFMSNFVYTFSKIKLRSSSGRQVFLLTDCSWSTNHTSRPCSYGYDIVPFHFGPFQKVVRRGVAFTRVRKKSSGPFQNRSRNWAVRKSEPEIGTIRYRTVQLSCEQKRYDIVPLSGPVWYLRVTPSWFL